jgi:hypothetical protein
MDSMATAIGTLNVELNNSRQENQYSSSWSQAKKSSSIRSKAVKKKTYNTTSDDDDDDDDDDESTGSSTGTDVFCGPDQCSRHSYVDDNSCLISE